MGRPGRKALRLAQQPLRSVATLPDGFDPSRPEQSFADCVPLAHRRRWGQFFTPPQVAEAMCDWVTEIRPRTLLDPAAGVGIFVRQLRATNPAAAITAIELDPLAAAALRATLPVRRRVEVLEADFLTWECAATFDGIVANPPYLRHHDLDYRKDIFDLIGARNGVQLTRLTNAYALFLLEIGRRLEPGGRAAVIVPSEWLNANFGRPVKHYLIDRQLLRHLIYFGHQTKVFSDVLTTACVLLLEKPKHVERQPLVHTVWLRELAAPASLELAATSSANTDTRVDHVFPASELRDEPKWSGIIERGAREVAAGFVPLAELATTSRGIATGANAFFHLSESACQAAGLPAAGRAACIGRAADATGLVFTSADLEQLVQRNRRVWLLQFGRRLSAAQRRYLDVGERAGLPDRYLLSVRRPWYRMESRAPAPIWAAVFGRRELRFVWNEAAILHLTTFHGVYPFDTRPVAVQALTAVLNSRAVQQRGRHQQRVYGGGLLKFEPRDLLQLQVPDLRRIPPTLERQLAALLQRLDHARRGTAAGLCPERTLDELDRLVMAAAQHAARRAASVTTVDGRSVHQ